MEQSRQPTQLPPEARAGLMRAWLAILRVRYPSVLWVPVVELVVAPEAHGHTINQRCKTF